MGGGLIMPITIAGSGIVAANIADGNITAAKLDSGQSGSAPIYAARALVNFNGTGAVAIRESGNVSSITDNGTGDYTVNFTYPMADANYAVVFSANYESASANLYYGLTASRLLASGSCRFVAGTVSLATARWYADDYATLTVAIFR